MAKNLAKYFIAIVPDGLIQTEAVSIKLEMKELFNLKYALQSPAHVTLKMPFNWNEAKEEKLTHSLDNFFKNFGAFPIHFHGMGRFGKRVIYIKVKESLPLKVMQAELVNFCRKDLNLVKELSDSAFHPHMTVAFKDLKTKRFEEYWNYASKRILDFNFNAEKVCLLKRIENRWYIIFEFELSIGSTL
jgi:2'-5' RNA ligase